MPSAADRENIRVGHRVNVWDKGEYFLHASLPVFVILRSVFISGKLRASLSHMSQENHFMRAILHYESKLRPRSAKNPFQSPYFIDGIK